MARNRFEEIFRFLHVQDNDKLEQDNKMAKVQPLLDYLNQKFMVFAPIEKNISVDEAMIPYFGRHGCKQHIHGKPVRFGFKAWVAATKLGYCLQFELYQGKSPVADRGELLVGEGVVTRLLSTIKSYYADVQQTEFSIYCDNFFTSPRLLILLQKMNVKGTGTVRKDRTGDCPLTSVDTMKKEKRGTFTSQFDAKIQMNAVRWKDNNVVTGLSTEFGADPVHKVQRYSAAEKRKITVDMPDLFKHYNTYMGGVDQLDANVAVYRIAVRGKKWYMPILLWTVDVVVNNAYLLSRSHGYSGDRLQFRRELASSLIKENETGKKKTGPARSYLTTTARAAAKRTAMGHFITNDGTRKRCVQCQNKTVKSCVKCKVHLHDKCFAQYHDN